MPADPEPSTSSGSTQKATNDESGTSAEHRSPSYERFDFSLFKQYLQIFDKVFIRKKASKIKTKTPPAITVKDYYENLVRVQQERERSQREKEQRKKEPEKKNSQRELKKGCC